MTQEVQVAMPPLDLETSLRAKRELGRMLGVHGPPSERGLQLADGFVHLVEKCVLEYQASRERLIEFMRDGYADDQFRARDHFETSAHALHRAIEYLDRLRQLGFRRSDGAPFIPRPRDLALLRESVRQKVRDVRDHIEHLDQDIVAGLYGASTRVGLHMGRDRVTIAGVEILYADFVAWVAQLHHFAALLSRVEIIVSDPIDAGGDPL